LNKIIFTGCCFWTLLIAGSLYFGLISTRNSLEKIHLQACRSLFEQIEVVRAWNTLHKGVYVPVTESVKPNPHLIDPMRDIPVNPDLMLTKINPSLMTKEISRLTEQRSGAIMRITSLNLLNPDNQALPHEQIALKQFENGMPEKWQHMQDSGQSVFFYMAPLKTDHSCLQCHKSQGYRIGDIRGGISITLPLLTPFPWKDITLIHAALLVTGLGGILYFGTALNRAHESLKRQATIDALTGLLNRRSFSEKIAVEFAACRRNNRPLSLIMCDVDWFKKFNDTYGHAAGDDCLARVAAVMKQSLKRPADFCARYGGEEFIMVLPDTSENGAMHVAERIREDVLNLDIAHETSPVKKVSVSLGVVTGDPARTSDYEQLTIQSDEALYRAKALGRNRVANFNLENHNT
jgi:diguanylate cyclase (GGDEF)-like protein